MKTGQRGRIRYLNNEGNMRKRLMEIGFITGSEIECVLQSPLGDPCAYLVKGSLIALRKEEASRIFVDCED